MKFILLVGRTVNRVGRLLLNGSRNTPNGLLAALVVATTTWAGTVTSTAAGRLPVVSASASADDGNVPANTLDGSLATRWSASGDGQWIRFDLGTTRSVGMVKLAWYKGDLRRARFDVQTSDTGTSWNTVFNGQSSGTSTSLESYDVTDASGRYVRIVGHGTTTDLWNSIAEAEFYEPGIAPDPVGLHLKVKWASSPANGPMLALHNGVAGTTYQVQVSSNLVNWTAAGYTFTNAGAVQTWQDDISRLPASLRKARYYRVQQTASVPPVTNLPAITKTYAKVQMGSKKMACYVNRPVTQYDPRVTRAIIVMHGAGANASAYFDRIDNVIPSSLDDKVMVIAPYFQGDGTTVPSGEWGWPDDDWREGGASGGISSYTVLDNFVELLRNGNFPNLKWIVVTGHSAGGQTAQRYAAFTDMDMKPWPNAQYMKFVVANPSSYFYLNQYRNPEGDSTWVVPSQDCSDGTGYNEWKYGLNGLYGYTAARGAEWARTHMQRRWVELLAGTADNFDNGDMDTDCGAMWQGPHRYARAHVFKMFMDKYYPANNLKITDVPGVDHDSTAMFSSSQGRNAFFFAD